MSFILDYKDGWVKSWEAENPEPYVNEETNYDEMLEHIAWLDNRWNAFKFAFKDEM